jgi:hypothetical protein
MAILGGSPLGLIGVLSTPTRDGLSTFNGGRTRNVNVNLYNVGKEADKEKLSKSGKKGGMFSLFTGGSIVTAWPNIGKIGGDTPSLGISEDDLKGVSRKTLHNNDIYDTSILNIIEKTANTSAQLRPSDFAYLKNLGVYPNNRLVIARRFGGPINDDIFAKGNPPMAVLITWRTPSEDFLEMSFGEDWIEAKADFTELLNNMAQDLLKMGGAGSAMGAAFGAIPLPGFTEAITRNVLAGLGVYDENAGKNMLPAGNPNLIKQAKRRKTVGYSEAGSGLKCTCSVKMTVEWEQKFISGIDPTIAFMDILSTCLRFSTSPGADYGLSKGFGAKLIGWVRNPRQMIKDFTSSLSASIKKAKDEVLKFIGEDFDNQIKDAPEEDPNAGNEDEDDTETEKEKEPTEKERLEGEKKKMTDLVTKQLDKLIGALAGGLEKTVQKYEHEVRGIVAALSGAPSTPWHVTIGNPLRPVFCSGDMYTDNATLKLGSTLAFNDLPANITLDFTLQNARPWGLQEIIAKFNTGHLRVVNTQKDFTSLNSDELLNTNKYDYVTSSSGTSGTSGVGTSGTSGGGSVNGNVDNKVDPNSGATTTPTKEGQDSSTINSDANSKESAVQGQTKKESMGTSGTSGVAGTSGNSKTAVDPLGDANATTKRGYTYEVVSRNGKVLFDIDSIVTTILVKQKDGVLVTNFFDKDLSTAQPPNISSLIDGAKKAANDV